MSARPRHDAGGEYGDELSINGDADGSDAVTQRNARHCVTPHGVTSPNMAERKPFLLRIDSEVLDAIQKWADDELRSLNGQIEFVLRRALAEGARARPKDPTQKAIDAQVKTQERSSG